MSLSIVKSYFDKKPEPFLVQYSACGKGYEVIRMGSNGYGLFSRVIYGRNPHICDLNNTYSDMQYEYLRYYS